MKRKRLSVIDTFCSEAPFATEFRRLLHKLASAGSAESELKSLLISSAMLSEGKSTVCSFLGITAASYNGMKTLIMDCDLRRPSIHRLFTVERDLGMAEILKEGFSPRDAIKKTSIDKLDIVTCGKYYPTPTELFDAEAIGSLADEMKFYYDLILVDAAPTLPVSDAMLLAGKMDAVLLVVKAGVTQKEVLVRAVDILDPNHEKIVGIVLNNLNGSLPYYHDYRYYGYQRSQDVLKSKAASRSRAKRGRKDGSQSRKTDRLGEGLASQA